MQPSLYAFVAALLAPAAAAAAGLGPLVDLRYAKYRGYYSSDYDLNVFKR